MNTIKNKEYFLRRLILSLITSGVTALHLSSLAPILIYLIAFSDSAYSDSSQLNNPSFDCSKASTPTEILICENRVLSNYDKNLGELYTIVLGLSDTPKDQKRAQLSWIRERNSCKDYSCLQDAYLTRITELDNLREKLTTLNQVKSAEKSGISLVKALNYGEFPDLLYFDDDRLYIARWQGDSSLEVYNRHTLDFVKSIPAIGADDEEQDSISSITSDPKNIYLSIEYRYPLEGRTNFIVIDKETLQTKRREFIRSLGELIFYNDGNIFSCSRTDKSCSLIDLTHMKVGKPESSLRLLATDYSDKSILINTKTYPDINYTAVTKNYIVTISNDKGGDLEFREKYGKNIIHLNASIDNDAAIEPIPESNTVIWRKILEKQYQLDYCDAEKRKCATLINADKINSFSENKNYISVADNDNVYIYCAENMNLCKIYKNLMKDSDQPTEKLGDETIIRTIFDEGRLLVITKNHHAKILDLEKIKTSKTNSIQ